MAKRSGKSTPSRARKAEELTRLLAREDGVIVRRASKFGQIIVAKQGQELLLLFCPLGVPLSNDALSGVMARIDLTAPTTLRGIYTQAMLCCLAFVPAPEHIYILGAGGGCLARTLRHLSPASHIEGSELDPEVLALSRSYFGLKTGPNLKITRAEGRAHLSARHSGRYDHIYIDCFGADGRVPRSLSTVEFYQMVAQKLTDKGVAAANLVETHPDFAAQYAAFLQSFAHVWRIEHEGTHVLFGSEADPSKRGHIAGTAQQLARAHDFGFDFAAHAQRLTMLSRVSASQAPLRDT